MLKQIQNKDELFAQTQEELRTFKRKSETIGKKNMPLKNRTGSY